MTWKPHATVAVVVEDDQGEAFCLGVLDPLLELRLDLLGVPCGEALSGADAGPWLHADAPVAIAPPSASSSA